MTLGIFMIAYALIMYDRIHKMVVAAAAAYVVCIVIYIMPYLSSSTEGILTDQQAWNAIDAKTLSLLGGMMVMVIITQHTGLFEFVAVRGAQLVKGRPGMLFFMLNGISALFSAMLDNVTTGLLISNVLGALCKHLEIKPTKYVLGIIFMANIGGTATLIGDPPCMMIGAAVGLSFNDFLRNLTVPSIISGVLVALFLYLKWRKEFTNTPEARQRILAMSARNEIRDIRLLRWCLGTFAVVLLLFVTHAIPPSHAAVGGAIFLLIVEAIRRYKEGKEAQEEHINKIVGEVEWPLLVFFGSMFILAGALEIQGVLHMGAEQVLAAGNGSLMRTTFIVLWVSGGASGIVDNIPYVAAMIPLVKSLAPAFGGDEAILPIWWALAMGACFGGNLTPIGASVNLAVLGVLRKKLGGNISIVEFTKYGAVATFIPLTIASLWMLTYF